MESVRRFNRPDQLGASADPSAPQSWIQYGRVTNDISTVSRLSLSRFREWSWMRRLRTAANSREGRRNSNVARIGIIAVAVALALLVIQGDLRDCFYSPLWAGLNFAVYCLAVPVTFLGTVMPWLIGLSLYRQVIEPRLPEVNATVKNSVLMQVLGLIVIVSTLVAPFFLLELIVPVSALPLTTAVCGLLWLGAAVPRTRRFSSTIRTTILATITLVIISIKFVDWDSRKTFARHLYRVHEGMTAVEVEKVMAKHLKNYIEPESEHYNHLVPGFSGTVRYRHSQYGWPNQDWGSVTFQNGRVVDVEMCLCD